MEGGNASVSSVRVKRVHFPDAIEVDLAQHNGHYTESLPHAFDVVSEHHHDATPHSNEHHGHDGGHHETQKQVSLFPDTFELQIGTPEVKMPEDLEVSVGGYDPKSVEVQVGEHDHHRQGEYMMDDDHGGGGHGGGHNMHGGHGGGHHGGHNMHGGHGGGHHEHGGHQMHGGHGGGHHEHGGHGGGHQMHGGHGGGHHMHGGHGGGHGGGHHMHGGHGGGHHDGGHGTIHIGHEDNGHGWGGGYEYEGGHEHGHGGGHHHGGGHGGGHSVSHGHGSGYGWLGGIIPDKLEVHVGDKGHDHGHGNNHKFAGFLWEMISDLPDHAHSLYHQEHHLTSGAVIAATLATLGFLIFKLLKSFKKKKKGRHHHGLGWKGGAGNRLHFQHHNRIAPVVQNYISFDPHQSNLGWSEANSNSKLKSKSQKSKLQLRLPKPPRKKKYGGGGGWGWKRVKSGPTRTTVHSTGWKYGKIKHSRGRGWKTKPDPTYGWQPPEPSGGWTPPEPSGWTPPPQPSGWTPPAPSGWKPPSSTYGWGWEEQEEEPRFTGKDLQQMARFLRQHNNEDHHYEFSDSD